MYLIHTHTHTFKHTYIQTYTPTNIHVYILVYMYIGMRICTTYPIHKHIISIPNYNFDCVFMNSFIIHNTHWRVQQLKDKNSLTNSPLW